MPFLLAEQSEGMEPDDLLCLRNARLQKALVGRAQWEINQAPSLRDSEQAWRKHLYRSMRAVKGSLAHSLNGGDREPVDPLCRTGCRGRVVGFFRDHVNHT